MRARVTTHRHGVAVARGIAPADVKGRMAIADQSANTPRTEHRGIRTQDEATDTVMHARGVPVA
ncbi:hypothetical protein Geu3261_0093_003 [Komagataeibacter europaeus NBRC 3261]|uniref:Uncharacterized protein n=1 Tax=Komagataeibacter europaeus NBRC 3261 TaxID=1234669 RepID=A0A0D6Q182_KOMEU|nr:hypothetical protein Geu3261_0093_003 [Komagataeibacter europaeus NBRC 3261]